jgi:oligoribonuclease NrnB/cAMP/cGMP phosphodiesterase (DHH superfamily)
VCHGDDLDGVASAILLTFLIQHKFKTTPEIYFTSYDNIDCVLENIDPDFTHLWIADLSLRNLSLTSHLKKFNTETFYFFDHHKDSAEFVNEISEIATTRFDSSGKYCATDLIFNYLKEEIRLDEKTFSCLEYLTKATHSRDLWINDISEGESLTFVIGCLGAKKTYNHLLESIDRVHIENFSEMMLACLDIVNKDIFLAKKLAEKSKVRYFYFPDSPKSCAAGISVITAFTNGWQSEVGDMLLKTAPLSIVALINVKSLTISLRTTDKIVERLGCGVNSIANLFNGGGHELAAGAPLNEDVLMRGPKLLLNIVLDAVDQKAYEKDGIKAR